MSKTGFMVGIRSNGLQADIAGIERSRLRFVRRALDHGAPVGEDRYLAAVRPEAQHVRIEIHMSGGAQTPGQFGQGDLDGDPGLNLDRTAAAQPRQKRTFPGIEKIVPLLIAGGTGMIPFVQLETAHLGSPRIDLDDPAVEVLLSSHEELETFRHLQRGDNVHGRRQNAYRVARGRTARRRGPRRENSAGTACGEG